MKYKACRPPFPPPRKKILLSSFQLNGHVSGFYPQTQKLQLPCRGRVSGPENEQEVYRKRQKLGQEAGFPRWREAEETGKLCNSA